MNRTITMLVLLSVCLLGSSLAFAQAAVPPLVYEMAKIESSLKPEGGTFPLTLLVYTRDTAFPDGMLTLEPSFADGWGRVFWQGQPVTFQAGDQEHAARLEFTIPYPALPVGGYLFRGRIRDANAHEVMTLRVPTGRFAPFGFQRDLLWMYWGGGNTPDVMATALQAVGINGSGGDALDYRFPYRWFKDHAVQEPTERYPEDVVLHPEGTQLHWYRHAHIGGGNTAHDGGFVLALMTDEVRANVASPAMRAARLRLAREDDTWMNVPTISRFNSFFQTDFLSWDEVLREGFPRLNHPQFQEKPIAWTADRAFTDIEAPMMRMECIRQANPYVAFAPGATHCLTDGNYDSFNARGYNNMTTLDYLQMFISAQPQYGLRPANRLVSLKASWLDGANFFGANAHLFWAALATNSRLFLLYGPGDGYGALPVTPAGDITPEGHSFREVRQAIHGLRPVILATRTRLEPAVLYLNHDWHDGGRNLMEGLVNCGVMPRGARTPDAATKLIFGISAAIDKDRELPRVVDAVRNGAGLVLDCTNDAPDVPAAFGIDTTGIPPAYQRPKPSTWEEIDLSPLAEAFPALQGVKVIGAWDAGGKARPGSGLKEIRGGDKLLAITGPYGTGWVLYLNFVLRDMFTPNGWGGSWGASNPSLLGDDSIPERNAALIRALLVRAGVPERLRVIDVHGRVHPYIKGVLADTADGAQQYVYIVSEPAGKLVPDPKEPKQATMTLACARHLSARLYLCDAGMKAVRDLRSRQFLPLHTDGTGTWVPVEMEAGQGTLLSLLPAAPVGTLSLHLSQHDVAGTETVHVELSRLDGQGQPLAMPAHTYWVRFLDPKGQEVEALSAWATGSGPHVFSGTFALNDPAGEWTVIAEDMTDGTQARAKLLRQEAPDGVRCAYAPAGPLVRGAPNQGMLHIQNHTNTPLPLTGLSVVCSEPGVARHLQDSTATIPAGGKGEISLTLTLAPETPVGPALLRLMRGTVALGGAMLPVPEAYDITFAPTPYLDGDLILTEIRGTVRTSVAGKTAITIRLATEAARAVSAQPAIVVTSPTAYTDMPFAIPLAMSRAQAQALRGLRNEGIALTMQAAGLPARTVNYKPNILPLARAPQRIGSLTGGEVSVRINNFTQQAHRVSMTCAPLPGGPAESWKHADTVQAQASVTLKRPRVRLTSPIDPGLYHLVLDWAVDSRACERTTMRIEEVLEQEWWVKAVEIQPGEDAVQDEMPPAFPTEPDARRREGWRQVVTQGVLGGAVELLPAGMPADRLYAATDVFAPQAQAVRVGFTGPTMPVRLWMNGELLDTPWHVLAKTDGMRPEPVPLIAGVNSVIVEMNVPLPKQTGTALVLQNPATGTRERTLRIGEAK